MVSLLFMPLLSLLATPLCQAGRLDVQSLHGVGYIFHSETCDGHTRLRSKVVDQRRASLLPAASGVDVLREGSTPGALSPTLKKAQVVTKYHPGH
jgi:hypothetical protein